MTKQEICANCGFRKVMHLHYGCKKFISNNYSPSNKSSAEVGTNIPMEDKKPEGLLDNVKCLTKTSGSDDESLSDKINDFGTYMEKDVKEAVRKEKALLILVRDGEITWCKFFQERDKIFGKELI